MKPSTEQDYHERIVRTLVYIQRHLDDELELEDLASVAAFSPFHFHRVFRGLVGESLKEHIRRLRLERAALKLKQQGTPVTDIALEAGFETHESFTRAFGTMFGVSPSEYRAAHKPAPESASGTHLDDVSGYHAPEYGEPLPVEMKELSSMNVVFLRHVGPYSQVGPTWGRLMSWAGMRGLLGPQTRMLGIVHDDPDITPTARVRYDAAVVVNRPVQPEGEFGVTEIPGGRYAVVTHQGPYDTLGKTYQRFFGGWLPQSGHELRDAEAFEEYLNSPMNAKPEDLLTRIHVPLRDL
ncbi:MAG: AraC family transcriptional regulator [Bryobacteraceae bacterium]